MKHIITVREIQDYLKTETWDRVAGCWGDASEKCLEVNNQTGDFRVTDHDAVKYLGPSLPEAVEAYNAAP